MIEPPKIVAIRKELERIGSASCTSLTFQDQLLSYLDMNAHRGDFLIEVGCFRGGMTAQLAAFAQDRGKVLHVVNVDRGMLEHARSAVRAALGESPSCVRYFEGSLTRFLEEAKPQGRCILVFIDGDHHYQGVVDDVRAVLDSALPRPISLCFHDYSLRYTEADHRDVRVDRAIRDVLGEHATIPIGEVAGLAGTLVCRPQPGDSGAHYQEGGSEGVVVVVPAPAAAEPAPARE